MRNQTLPNCASCIVSLQAALLNNGISPEVIHEFLSKHLRQDQELHTINKGALSFEERMSFQINTMQLYAFLSLLDRIKTHS